MSRISLKSSSVESLPSEEVFKKDDAGSPVKYSRLHEKEDLANLNNRLACYIERVRCLELENNHLMNEIRNSEAAVSREVTIVKDNYESELTDARKLMDEQSREIAKLQIDSRRLFAESSEIKSELEAKTKELLELNEMHGSLEKAFNELSNQHNALLSEKKNLADKLSKLKEEKKVLIFDLKASKRELEEEILKRVDAENALLTSHEQFSFNEQLLKQQLLETQRKIEHQVTECDSKLNREYEEKLCRSLQEIRDQYEFDMEDNKKEIKKLYEEKMKVLENQLVRNCKITEMSTSECRDLKLKYETLKREVNDLETEKNAAVYSAREADRKLDELKAKYIENYTSHEAEIKKLQEEMARQSQDYEELMDVKTALDLEISAYRKLLEVEEARLNIKPVESPSRQSSFRRILRGKRRHSVLDESDVLDSSSLSFNTLSNCGVSISEISPDKNYIKLENKSDKDVSLGQWQLVQNTGAATVFYKFNKTFKLAPEESVTVWSSGTKVVPECASNINIIMSTKKWIHAGTMTITLLNNSKEEMASARKMKSLSRSKSLNSESSSAMSSTFNISGKLPEERCVVM